MDIEEYRIAFNKRKKEDKSRADFPDQLKDNRLRFCKIEKNDKKPFESDWNIDPNKLYKYNDERLLNAIRKHGINYGVQCGYGSLIVIDWDDREIYNKHHKELPDTFQTQSPSIKGCPHSYYFIKNNGKPNGFRVDNENGDRLADVQGMNTCVVGPGSVHPDHIDGSFYKVVNDIPIAETTLEKIKDVFSQYKIIQDKEKTDTIKKYHSKNDIFNEIKERVLISHALMKMGIDSQKNPTACPFHESKGGACLSFDDNKRVWHCFHCEKEGSVIDLVAIAKGLDPNDKKDLIKVIKFLKKETGIEDKTPELNITDNEYDADLYALELSASEVYEREIYTFKDEWMVGLAEKYINTFHEEYYPNIPKAFLYFSYLTAFSSLVSKYIKIDAQFEDQPRLYTLLVTNSGGQKSVSINAILELYNPIEDFHKSEGFGSGEGVIRILNDHKNILICPDEFISFLDKGSIRGSTLITLVGTLFSNNSAANEKAKAKDSLMVEDGYISFLSATTDESFENGWSDKIKGLGFGSRLLLIPGKINKWVIKDSISPDMFESHRRELVDLIDWVNNTKNGTRWPGAVNRKLMKRTARATTLHNDFCNNFTMNLPNDIQNRLQVYNLRLACLFALLQRKHEIDSEDIKRSIDIMKWQANVRMEKIPTVTDDAWAEHELWIKNYFIKRRKTLEGKFIYITSLKKARQSKIDKTGSKKFDQALDHLVNSGQIIQNDKKIKYIFDLS